MLEEAKAVHMITNKFYIHQTLISENSYNRAIQVQLNLRKTTQ